MAPSASPPVAPLPAAMAPVSSKLVADTAPPAPSPFLLLIDNTPPDAWPPTAVSLLPAVAPIRAVSTPNVSAPALPSSEIAPLVALSPEVPTASAATAEASRVVTPFTLVAPRLRSTTSPPCTDPILPGNADAAVVRVRSAATVTVARGAVLNRASPPRPDPPARALSTSAVATMLTPPLNPSVAAPSGFFSSPMIPALPPTATPPLALASKLLVPATDNVPPL